MRREAQNPRMGLLLFLRWIGLFALFLASVTVCRAEQSPKWIQTYNGLLGKYVTNGGVKYAAWKNNPADMQAIQQVVDGIAQEDVSGLSKKEQLAFYINAYNAWILHEALGKYPTKSVKDLLFTFFTGQRIKVAGEKMSFNHLEKDIIRPKFGEPRVHCRAELREPQLSAAQPGAFPGGQTRCSTREAGRRFRQFSQRRRLFRGEKHRRTFRDFQLVQGRLQSGRWSDGLHQPATQATLA